MHCDEGHTYISAFHALVFLEPSGTWKGRYSDEFGHFHDVPLATTDGVEARRMLSEQLDIHPAEIRIVNVHYIALRHAVENSLAETPN